ncbi:MAG: hypothetical protein KDB14_29175 [Planctomycetales bacterium]|nr:hypothetical protein [Planctomycetales bacterium]
MIHYSCDRCKKTLSSGEVRYVVRMEVQATLDDEDNSEDRDYLSEIHEILERQDAMESDDFDETLYTRKSFDLCESCRHALVANPLGRPSPIHNLPFSAN